MVSSIVLISVAIYVPIYALSNLFFHLIMSVSSANIGVTIAIYFCMFMDVLTLF
jgi:hypothetical protein